MQTSSVLRGRQTLAELVAQAATGDVIEIFPEFYGTWGGVDSNGSLFFQKGQVAYQFDERGELVEVKSVMYGLFNPQSVGYLFQKREDKFSFSRNGEGKAIPLGTHECDQYVAGAYGIYLLKGRTLSLLVIKP